MVLRVLLPSLWHDREGRDRRSNGVIAGTRPGGKIADCSTIPPAISKAFAASAQFLDASCTGSAPGAEEATLTFMIGGAHTRPQGGIAPRAHVGDSGPQRCEERLDLPVFARDFEARFSTGPRISQDHGRSPAVHRSESVFWKSRPGSWPRNSGFER